MSSHVSLVTFKFDNFDNFKSLPTIFGAWSEGVTDSNGNQWRAALFPGRRARATEEESHHAHSMVLFGLVNMGPNDLNNVKFSVLVRNKHGSIITERLFEEIMHRGEKTSVHNKAVLSKDESKGILIEGALHIECVIQIKHEVNFVSNLGEQHFYVPPNPFAKNASELLKSGKNSDISFAIEGEIIHAHVFMLELNAPIFASFCEGHGNDSPLQLKGITPEVFRIILRYVYAGDPPGSATIIKLGKEIIDAANRFGIEGLKLAAETTLVAHRVIDLSNAAAYLIFADAKTCPLLKEYAMSYCVARSRDILRSDTSSELKESAHLLQELIMAMTERPSSTAGAGDDVRLATVDALRRMLAEKSLDVDGSKEALVSRIESSD